MDEIKYASCVSKAHQAIRTKIESKQRTATCIKKLSDVCSRTKSKYFLQHTLQLHKYSINNFCNEIVNIIKTKGQASNMNPSSFNYIQDQFTCFILQKTKYIIS